MVDVRRAVVVGSDLGSGDIILHGTRLFGTRFAITTPVSVRTVGMWGPGNVSVGTQARIGVYDESGKLVAATGVVAFAPGRNVYPVQSAQPLATGSVWIVAVFDRASYVFGRMLPGTVDLFASDPLAITEPLPPALPAGSALGYDYSQFLIGID